MSGVVQILAGNLAGGGGGAVLPATIAVSDTRPVFGPPAAIAFVELTSSGAINEGRSSGITFIGTWLLRGAASLYEARATVTSGSLTFGTTGTWLNLGSSRTWGVDRASLNAIGSTTATFTLEIRRGTNILATSTVTVTATTSD